MRFSILKRIYLPEYFRGQRATLKTFWNKSAAAFDSFG
jgi:hypothetical protein